jgi:hypothetical protein
MQKLSNYKELNEIRVFSFKEKTQKFTISIDDVNMTKDKAESLIVDIKNTIEQHSSIKDFGFNIEITT